ncbi:hypothetical protein VPH35_076548 [Triticum aestivum]
MYYHSTTHYKAETRYTDTMDQSADQAGIRWELEGAAAGEVAVRVLVLGRWSRVRRHLAGGETAVLRVRWLLVPRGGREDEEDALLGGEEGRSWSWISWRKGDDRWRALFYLGLGALKKC